MQGYSHRQTYPSLVGAYGPSPDDDAAQPLLRDTTQDIYARLERHQLVRNDGAHIASVPQRESRGYESMPQNTYGSPEDDDDPNGYYGDYGANRSSQDLDRKQRKRLFSNHTNTEYMTCRRRKEKCDEQNPECKTASTVFRTACIHYIGERADSYGRQ